MANKEPSTSQQPMIDGKSHGNRKPQIKKEDLYMLMALWMEQSPWAMTTTDKERVVGAVFVQPNDRILSVDCSRENDGGIVHGAIRALLKYPDQVEGCYVYLSRPPCAHCVKMLVQAAVKKVFYLPLKPEKDEEEENKSVDALFKVSPVSREVYVPNITKGDLDELESANQENLYGTRILKRGESIASKVKWADESVPPEDAYERKEWKELENAEGIAGWVEYSDQKIKSQVHEDLKNFFEWYVKGILETGEKEKMAWKKVKVDSNAGDKQEVEAPDKNKDKFDHDVANHLSRLAQMLSNRTDDPNRGVGCVIINGKEIVATGWNGFPAKALYGNHPRQGKSGDGGPDKYPHVIHAEQNALMRRNKRILDGATAFVNKIPCNECLPMLCDAGVKTLYLSKGAFKKRETSEKNFYELLENPGNPFIVYEQY